MDVIRVMKAATYRLRRKYCPQRVKSCIWLYQVNTRKLVDPDNQRTWYGAAFRFTLSSNVYHWKSLKRMTMFRFADSQEQLNAEINDVMSIAGPRKETLA